MIALNLLAQAAIMAVVALGAWTAMGEEMILARLRKWIERTNAPAFPTPGDTSRYIHLFPAWVRNPLVSCPRCMCSVWGIVALLALGYDFGSTWNIIALPVLILAAVGIQELLHRP